MRALWCSICVLTAKSGDQQLGLGTDERSEQCKLLERSFVSHF